MYRLTIQFLLTYIKNIFIINYITINIFYTTMIQKRKIQNIETGIVYNSVGDCARAEGRTPAQVCLLAKPQIYAYVDD